MKKTSTVYLAMALMLLSGSLAMSHPHLLKTVTTKLPGGVDVTLDYLTVPVNETYVKQAAVGEFISTRRAPKVKLSGELKAGNVTLPAGEYVIGVIKNADNNWTMALYPGQLGMNEKPDKAKLILLDSAFSNTAGTSEHMLIDISPGSGKFEGKVVLTWHFGSQFLAGAIN